MIIDKYVKICVTSGNKTHFKTLGYDVKHGEFIEIPIEHLSKCSHQKINCQCDTCGNMKLLTYQCYLIYIEYDDKYYCSNCMKEKRKKILKEKYSVENVFQLESVKKQSSETKIKKYSNEYYRNDEKREETILEKYGCINVFQNEEIKKKLKETNIKNLGVPYPMQNIDIKEKSCQTNIKNLGVPYTHQNKEVFEKSFKSNFKIGYHDNGLLYQGSYEKDFLEHCEELKIIDLISKPKSIKYLSKNDKRCYYHPDFHIEKLNLIIEIKSDYWYKVHKERNILKESSVKEQGFNFIMILNKDYTEFDHLDGFRN